MSKNSGCNYFAAITAGLVALIFTSVFFILTSTAYFYQLQYESSTCNITDVTYPTTFPTEDTLNLWSTCDCGKHCQARYPCVTLFMDENIHTVKYDYSKREEICTITETSCPSGEDSFIVNQELTENIALAETYINATIGCFKHSTSPESKPVFLYIDMESVERSFITASSFIGVNVLFLISVYIYCLVRECKNKNKSEKSSSEKPAFKA